MSRSSVSFSTSLVVLSLLSACAAPSSPASPDPKSSSDLVLAEDSPEASAVLAFVNDGGATAGFLDAVVELDSRAARGIAEHRDGTDGAAGTSDDDRFESISELDAISWVGPVALSKLIDFANREGWIAAQPGIFEGVRFDASEVTAALDLVNNAPLALLDVDAKLDARAAQNIVAARPIQSVSDLAAIAWVGPSAMSKIHGFLPFWEELRQAPETYDGVVFTTDEGARALAAANGATPGDLEGGSITGAQATVIVAGRPWASLAGVSAAHGIGPMTMSRLRDLGAAWTATPYTLSAADSAAFGAAAKQLVDGDDAWRAEIEALLQDETGATEFPAATAHALTLAVDSRIDTFAEISAGRGWSSRSAAQDAFTGFARGLESTVIANYPEGALTLLPPITEAAALARAKLAILHYFQFTEVNQADFQSNIGRTWDEIAAQVRTDTTNFESKTNYYVDTSEERRVFVGEVYGLHTEVTVDYVGKVTNVLIEVD